MLSLICITKIGKGLCTQGGKERGGGIGGEWRGDERFDPVTEDLVMLIKTSMCRFQLQYA